MASASTTPPIFNVNERVLCYHGPLIYEAKVLKATIHDENTTPSGQPGAHYFVHYKGWKQTWDEWVPANRLLKLSEANVALQKSLQQTNTAGAQGGGTSSKAHPRAAGGNKDNVSTRAGARKDGTRGTKRAREEDDSNKRPEMKLNIPETLRARLVDDWERVTKHNQLVKLPRSPNVVELLSQYAEYVKATKPPHLKEPALIVPTVVFGLQCYFDRALGANLLYRFERPQYAQIRMEYWTGPKVVYGTEKEMSVIYGAEHLLRMLVSLPQMIASSSLDSESVALVRDYANELLVYMEKEKDRIFQREYDNASLAYQSAARS
ncbi:MRG-domain-containing protein [Crassisporium funariophilum]|nr:MRG-domain-containing protein [Crassisporium funariophilum]